MTAEIMNQSTWQNQVMDNQGEYLVVDLQNPQLVTYQLDQKGRVGDNMRTYKFALKDGVKPHALGADSVINVFGSDAKGKIKILTIEPQTDGWEAGRVTVKFPQAFFETAGYYRRMLLEVRRGNEIEASVNFSFGVMPNDFSEIVFNDTDFWNVLDEIKNDVDNIDNLYVEQLIMPFNGKSGFPHIDGYKYNFGAGIAQADGDTLNKVEKIGVELEFPDSEHVCIKIQTQNILNLYEVNYEPDGSAIYLTSGNDNLAFYIRDGYRFVNEKEN